MKAKSNIAGKKVIAVALVIAAISVGTVSSVAMAAHKDSHRVQVHETVRVLPSGHHRIVFRGKSYYYSAGRFYRNQRDAYVVIAAPLGAIVPSLPVGYISFGTGIRRHFYFEGVYYRQVENGYEVIEKPAEAEQVLVQGSDRLIVYPAAGQDDEQRDRDRFECHEWASAETQFDPTNPDLDASLRSDYYRALGACLEARDYVVK